MHRSKFATIGHCSWWKETDRIATSPSSIFSTPTYRCSNASMQFVRFTSQCYDNLPFKVLRDTFQLFSYDREKESETVILTFEVLEKRLVELEQDLSIIFRRTLFDQRERERAKERRRVKSSQKKTNSNSSRRATSAAIWNIISLLYFFFAFSRLPNFVTHTHKRIDAKASYQQRLLFFLFFSSLSPFLSLSSVRFAHFNR